MGLRAVAVLAGCALLATAAPSLASPDEPRPVQLVVERIDNTGPAQFRLDLTVEPGSGEGFIGGVQASLDKQGRPLTAQPLPMTSLNQHREPAVYADDLSVSTCDVGLCEIGRTAAAGMTVIANDTGPAERPVVVIAVLGHKAEWTFTASNYRLRVVPPRFRYVTGDSSRSVGVDYIGTGAEAFVDDAVAPSAARGSLAVAAGPCSTSGTNAASRGAGQISLDGGLERVQEVCPRDDGVLAQVAQRPTTWRVAGPAAGDQEFRGARLLVVDLPLS